MKTPRTYPPALHEFAVAVATRARYLAETQEVDKEVEAQLWKNVVEAGNAISLQED